MKTLLLNFATLLACLRLMPMPVCLADVPAPGGGDTNAFSATWSFQDTTNWTSDAGYYPAGYTNITSATNADGTALQVDSSSPAYLAYNLVETDGTVELQVDRGGIMVWVRPHWNSGDGPGWPARIVEVGAYTTNASFGWFSLYTDSGGTNLYFSSQNDSGSEATWLSCAVTFTSNVWTYIALSYSYTNTALWVNSQLLTNGPGVTIWPGSGAMASPWFIGSDSSGGNQIRGDIDDLWTSGTPLDQLEVQSTYDIFGFAYDAEALLSMMQSSTNYYWTNSPTFQAVVGPGNLGFAGIATNCASSTNVWITNLVATIVGSGTNATVTLTFTIFGGQSGVFYDVYANAVPGPTNSPAYGWAWMGQGQSCHTYTLANMPTASLYLTLGLPIDSDGDGLRDLYEILITHTDPHNPDSSGDGMWDGWKVVWWLSPSVKHVSQPTERSNYTYNQADWMQQISGIKNGSVTLDAEGNVQQTTQ